MKNVYPILSLEQRHPVLAIEDDCILSVYGDVTIGFKVSLPEIFTQSLEDYDQIHALWSKAIKVLPVYSYIHKQDIFFEKEYTPFTPQMQQPSFLSKASNRHFFERAYREHECYLYITLTTKQLMYNQSVMSILCRGKVVPEEITDQERITQFKDSVDMFVSIVASSKHISLTRLTEKEYISDTNKVGLLDKHFSLEYDAQKKFIQKEIQLIENDIKVGDKHIAVHSISSIDELPSMVSPASRSGAYSSQNSNIMLSFSSPLGIMFPYNHIYNQYIFIDHSKDISRKLQSEANRMFALQKFSRDNAANHDSIMEFLDSGADQSLQIVRAHANVIAWSESQNEIKQIKNEIAAAIATMDCNSGKSHKATYNSINAPIFYWAACPGGGGFPIEETFITFVEQACCLLTNETSYRSSLSPIGLRMADRQGKPINVDISDEPYSKQIIFNRNKFILGPSGSGKSFFTNHYVHSYYAQGSHVVLVDVGHSYQGLCQLINQQTNGQDGIYITHTEQTPISINPFYTDDYQYPLEKQETIQALLYTLWKKESETSTSYEDTVLEGAVTAYIQYITQNRDVYPCFNTFYEFLDTGYREILQNENVNQKNFDIDDFRFILRKYYKGGKYDFLLNSEMKIDLLKKRFVVFELDTIKDTKTLFAIVTLVIMETFINKMRRLGDEKKVIVIEEAWKAITRTGMAHFILYLEKTVRKFQGEMVMVTQDIEDIISSEIVKNAVINNSDCIILLDQAKFANRFDEIQRLLSLTSQEKDLILSINKNNDRNRKYKEVYIKLGAIGKVYALETSYTEYLAFTTEKKEKKVIMDIAQQYNGNIELAINHITYEN